MYFPKRLMFWFVLNITWIVVCSSNLLERSDSYDNFRNKDNLKGTYHSGDTTISHPNDVLYDTCSLEDFACLAMAASDRLGLEAIKALHQKLDDDENGNIDFSESDDFLREELKYDSGSERRQKAFHKNDDMHISVKELWEAWLRSEVHNWTIEQTTDWLTTNVELPQYVPNFIQFKVAGAMLPRLAVNNNNYLIALGVKDPIHKQKISLKAMDVVLFGSPKDGKPNWKDLTLIFLVVIGGIGVWYGYRQNKSFKYHMNRMNRDMDSLQNAEKALDVLQKKLEEAELKQESVISEKQNLEKKLEFSSAPGSYSDLEISQLKAEIEMLRTELQIAEGELKDRCWVPPPALQQWLQLTHEVENKSYIKKKISAEKQLQQAREACEKLRKKRSSLVGAFVSTHGKSIDEVDRSIVEARTALNEVTHELQERVHRWKQIESLCGFNIINNSGFQFLENVLYRNVNGRLGSKARMSSQDDLDDDSGSVYGSHQGFMETTQSIGQWKEGDSSGSEASRLEDETTSTVHFMVGGETSNWTDESIKQKQSTPNFRSNSNNNIVAKPTSGVMVRSYSQDTNMTTTLQQELLKPKISLSETSLDNRSALKQARPKVIREHQPTIAIDEDVCSTDSSLVDEDLKKKKRKLFNFSTKKRDKTKGD